MTPTDKWIWAARLIALTGLVLTVVCLAMAQPIGVELFAIITIIFVACVALMERRPPR